MLRRGVHRFDGGAVGSDLADKLAVEIAVLTSRQVDQAAIFNYASQAHNNHFFFDSLVNLHHKKFINSRVTMTFVC